MANEWSDQPGEASGLTLFHHYVSCGKREGSMQIQQAASGEYSGTFGNLFGSQTIMSYDLVLLLRTMDQALRTKSADCLELPEGVRLVERDGPRADRTAAVANGAYNQGLFAMTERQP